MSNDMWDVGSNPPPSSQPGWGQPVQSPPPRKPFWKRGWFISLAVIGTCLVLFAGCIAVVGTAVTDSVSREATVATDVPANEDEGVTEEETGPETTDAPSGPAIAKVGDTLTMTDGFGEELADITVGGPTSPSGNKGIRFSTGGEYDDPKHGLYMGVWVKVKALSDGVETVYGDLHVAQGGQHYPGDACCPDGFNPTLDYATLSKGETSQGWVVFDLRSRHGEIVIADYDGKKIGVWKF